MCVCVMLRARECGVCCEWSAWPEAYTEWRFELKEVLT